MWADRYVGIPFKVDGTDRDGLDCWQLYRLVMRERCGVELPSKQGIHTEAGGDLKAIAAAMAEEAARWRRVDAPQEYDLILMRRGEVACHVGMCLGGGRMLHITNGIDSTNEPYDGRRWRDRIVGFYRYGC